MAFVTGLRALVREGRLKPSDYLLPHSSRDPSEPRVFLSCLRTKRVGTDEGVEGLLRLIPLVCADYHAPADV
jgi:hypothetical protein